RRRRGATGDEGEQRPRQDGPDDRPATDGRRHESGPVPISGNAAPRTGASDLANVAVRWWWSRYTNVVPMTAGHGSAGQIERERSTRLAPLSRAASFSRRLCRQPKASARLVAQR